MGEICVEVGFEGYEVFNYVKSGFESWYNLIYWCYGDYVGIGSGVYGCFILGG